MKITKQQIDIIANAMVKELYDPKKIGEEKDKLIEPYLKGFKKTAIYKQAVDAFKNPLVNRIEISRTEFENVIPEELRSNNKDYYYYDKHFGSIMDFEKCFNNACRDLLPTKQVNTQTLKDKIVVNLTLKSLGCDDIYAVLDDIKASMKKEFNL